MGQLQGEGIWLLRFEDGVTDITYVYRVELTLGWKRWLAPPLPPPVSLEPRRGDACGWAGVGEVLGAAKNPSQ